MSRIGKSPIRIPDNVTVAVTPQGLVQVKGPKGELSRSVDAAIEVAVHDREVKLTRKTDQKKHKALHGLYRSLINNMVIGVSQGYKKSLELVGVGYKASAQNNVLEMSLGYSHGVFVALPSEVAVQAETVKGKNPIVHLESSDKQLIGQVAAKLRSLRKIEPYKGKGIKFVGEEIRRKVGKSAAK